MCLRYLIPTVWMALLLLGTGCQDSNTSRTKVPAQLPPLATDTVLRVHWIGKRQLAVEGSAFYFTRVWDLPESKQLEARTFDKLAAAPWNLLKGAPALSESTIGVLRPLLDSIAYEESYLEIRATKDGPFQLALAIQLKEDAAQGWQNNLTLAVQSLTGFSPAPRRDGLPGWTVVHPQAPARIEFARTGDWTVLGIATAGNELMDELIERVTAFPDPFGAKETNLWLRLNADLNWLTDALGLAANPSEWPTLSAAVNGDGGHVLTDCELTFPQPFAGDLPPWTIPKDAIKEPLTSFLAVRGLRSVFTRLPGWSQLPLGEIPDQAYAWSYPGSAFQLYLATPIPDAQARMRALTAHLLNQVNPWLRTNGPEVNGEPCPLFHEMPNATGVEWGQMQGLKPLAQTISANGSDFLLAGLIRPSPSESSPGIRHELVSALSGPTNLVCLGWEDTRSRLAGWSPVLQTARAVTGNAPLPDQCLSLQWLENMQSRVGATETTITRTGPNTLSIHRKSSLGFNAAELHLMADWLESPQFPRGLHTFLGQSAQKKKQ